MRSFKIKICGITNVTDAKLAAASGADAIGLNFYKRSSRYVTAADALEIVSGVPDDLAIVGVFVNHDVEAILELHEHLQFSAVQLHGDESPDWVGKLRSLDVIRAIRIGGDSVSAVHAAQREIDAWCDAGVSGVLLDKAAKSVYGGTGETFDWQVSRSLTIPSMTILAGGLNQENVAEAIKTVSPNAVDVASGVEGVSGRKDPELLCRFVKAALSAFARV